MSQKSAFVVGPKSLLIDGNSEDLLLRKDLPPALVKNEWTGPCSFFRVAPAGDRYAFYNKHEFVLANIDGSIEYHRYVNPDKAEPLDIRFSPDGEVVAFFEERELDPKIHLYSFRKRYETELHSNYSGICCDPEFRHFALRNSKGQVAIVNRHHTYRKVFNYQLEWKVNLGLESNDRGLVVFDGETLEWLSPKSGTLVSAEKMTFPEKPPQGNKYYEYVSLEPTENLVLMIWPGICTYLVHREKGIVWKSSAHRRVSFDETGLLAQNRVSGEIIHVSPEGLTEVIFRPEEETAAAVCGFFRPNLTWATLRQGGERFIIKSTTISYPKKELIESWETILEQ